MTIILYIIGSIFAILFCIVLFFVYIIFVQWKIDNFLLNRFGRSITGKVIGYTKEIDSSDSEYDEYVVEYMYETNGRKKEGSYTFSMNTSHRGWANIGGLIGTPKLVTTTADLEERFQAGKPVFITYVPFLPSTRNIEFEKHPNELIDEQKFESYKHLPTAAETRKIIGNVLKVEDTSEEGRAIIEQALTGPVPTQEDPQRYFIDLDSLVTKDDVWWAIRYKRDDAPHRDYNKQSYVFFTEFRDLPALKTKIMDLEEGDVKWSALESMVLTPLAEILK